MSSESVKRTAQKNTSSKPKFNISFFGTDVFINGGFDIIFLILVLALLTIGLVMMFSASYISAKYAQNDSAYYIKKQLVYSVIGIVLMFVCSKLNPEFVKKMTIPVAIISTILLVLVLVHPQVIEGKEDFKRWLKIGISFQPSDIAKLGIIMLFAWLLERFKRQLETKWWVAPAMVCLLGVFCLLIYKENHLSCTVLVAAIGIGMMFLGGADRRWFIYGGIVVLLAVVVLVAFRHDILKPYQAERIDSFFQKDYLDTDTRWQTNQSLYALGSGGFFGLGLGKSRQKYLFMPEPQNDFIFAIVGEELGFLRSALIILIFAALIFEGFVIAMKAKTMFERMLVFGITLQIGLQTILNILVVTDVVPNTGISLPFFSFGGTALVMQLIEVGLVLAVSRTGERRRRKAENDE